VLEPFGPGLWIADGPIVEGQAGFRFPTRMAVVRLAGDGLLVWSPVALDGGLRRAVVALGPVRQLLAPNTLHHSFLAEWQRAFPDATTLAPAELAAARPDLRIDVAVGAAPVAAWAGAVEHVLIRTALTSEIVLFHVASGTVLFCDLLQHFAPGWFRGWRGLIARLDLMEAGEPSVPRKYRLRLPDPEGARAAVARIGDWPARQVLMAHGPPVMADAPALIARAFRWLRR
jgi:hypothetical protein